MNENATKASGARSAERAMRLLTRLEVRERLGNISDDKFYGMIREGALPLPLKLGTSSRWLESEVEAFIAKLAESRTLPVTPPGISRHHTKLEDARKRSALHLLDGSTPQSTEASK